MILLFSYELGIWDLINGASACSEFSAALPILDVNIFERSQQSLLPAKHFPFVCGIK